MYTAAWTKRKAVLLVAVALIATALGTLAYAGRVLRGPELETINARFAIRGLERQNVAGVVVVGIDDSTFSDFRNQNLPAQWPFPRRYHARVIDELRRAGAKVIAFDVQFTEPTDTADDNALIEAVGRAHNMVLATTSVGPHGTVNVLGGEPLLGQLGAHVGNTSVIPDSDGILRNMQYSIDGLKTFPVVAAEAEKGHPISPSLFGGVRHAVPIDYSGPPGTMQTVSYSRVYNGQFPPGLFAGKLVIVGATASSLQDLHQVPTSSSPMPGPEVMANATAAVLAGLPLRYAPGWVNIALIVILGCAAPLSSLRVPALRSLLGSLALGALTVVAIQLAFNKAWIVAVTYPLLALAIAALGTLSVIYLSEAFERQHVRELFTRFVPTDVVNEVLARTDGNLRLGGVERDCTVLFSDLRGFTSFSETQSPESVIEVINFYLNEMTGAILDAGGTLVSYMGDGVMALFGAPLVQLDHADRALAAAREMIGPRLGRLNAWLQEQGYTDGFRMGVGLNSGLVMAGNVGSERRLEYTAIGDTTNTAARLESMTKGTDHQLFIAKSTCDALTRPCEDLVFVDELEVRGRQGTVRVWTLATPRHGSEPSATEPAVDTSAGPFGPANGRSPGGRAEDAARGESASRAWGRDA
jgi:adenylate cyclase